MTAPPPPHRHNGGPLNDDDARKLWNHIRALENLEEQKADLNLDVKARKELAKADGFDTNIVLAIVKRRKQGAGETRGRHAHQALRRGARRTGRTASGADADAYPATKIDGAGRARPARRRPA
jgi:uncharacterized protein (UPF0335 family)